MSGFNDFSTSAASNASVGSINFAEGQLPSTVNNSARQLMADMADVRDGNVVLSGWHVKANGLTIQDQSDTTKKVIFDVSGQSAGTTKTIAMPVSSGTLALTSQITTDAPADATYIVVSTNGTLSAERVLTAGSNINITDSSTAGTITVAASIPPITSIFSAKFTSTDQNLPAAGATLTVAHGLGAAPFNYDIFMKCSTIDGGWAVGDTIKVALDPHSATTDKGVISYANATNVYVLIGASGMNMYNKSTGAAFGVTLASWKFVVKAWL
jgi:hypothetical protein